MSRTIKLASIGALGLSLMTFALPTQHAHAGGNEIATGGTRGIGRGGANAVAPNDPMAMLYNPAALANLNTDQFLLNIDTVFHSQCVDPYGYYGWGIYEGGRSEFSDTSDDAIDSAINRDYLNQPLGQVCNSGWPAAVPQMVMALKLLPELGIAFGFANPAALGNAQWGGKDGTIQTDQGPRPTPTRYQLISTQTEPLMALSVAAGYRVQPWLSVGLTLQWLGAKITNRAVQPVNAGTSPHDDMFVEVVAQDAFVPTATFAVQAKPTDNIELMAAFHWSDTFDGSGDATYTTNYYQHKATVGAITRVNDPIALDTLYTRLPWSLTLGGRYADVIAPPASLTPDVYRPADGLQNERWDVELNVVWNMLGRTSASKLAVGDTCDRDEDGARIPVLDNDGQPLSFHEGCQWLEFRTASENGNVSTQTFDVPPENGDRTLDLSRHWKDQLIVRLGGSFNPLPNRLGFNAGVFYETRGIEASYANIDSMPFMRVGLGLGATVRVGRWDLMLAYSHVFQETLIIAPPEHQNRQDGVTGDPTSGFDQRIGARCTADAPGPDCDPVVDPSVRRDGAADATARLQQSSILEQRGQVNRVVNAGKYTGGYDVLSLGFNYRF